jgi:hypothetical protein
VALSDAKSYDTAKDVQRGAQGQIIDAVDAADALEKGAEAARANHEAAATTQKIKELTLKVAATRLLQLR